MARCRTERVIEQMRAKGGEMPRDEVLVYCVSCSKSMFVAGKRPRYLVDLLFAEETVPGTSDPDAWHASWTSSWPATRGNVGWSAGAAETFRRAGK